MRPLDFSPLTILPLYDIQIGYPMTISIKITPKLQISIDHGQSLLDMFSFCFTSSLKLAAIPCIYLKSRNSSTSGGKYSGVVKLSSAFTLLKLKHVPKSITLTYFTLFRLKSILSKIFSDLKSQCTRPPLLRRLSSYKRALITRLSSWQLFYSKISKIFWS